MLLNETQLEAFKRNGYLVVESLFNNGDLQPVIDEIDEAIDHRAREAVAGGALTRSYERYPFETRLAQINNENHDVATSMWDGQLNGPAFFNLIRHNRLLDLAEQLMGPELIASSVYRLRPKVPNHAKSQVPWHQDSGYLDPFCDNALILTVWIPFVDANKANGCLWIIPAAHQGNELYCHRRAHDNPYLVIDDDRLPRHRAVCVPVNKGSVLLLTNRTPHASFENHTDMVRWSMDLRYQSAALPTNAPISQIPGESSNSGSEDVPPACYPPEPDFLVRSRARPSEVMTKAAEFHELRDKHLQVTWRNRWK